MKEDVRAFRTFQTFLDDMANGLAGVERWKHFPERKHQDHGLQHAFQTALLAITMLALEREHGAWSSEEGDDAYLDGERIVAGAVTHDIGEWLLGDVRYSVKQDERVAVPLREIELELYRDEILGNLPESVAGALDHASAIQDDSESRSGRFFNAVERVGYVLFAIREYREGNHKLGMKTFQHQHELLLVHAKEFASVRIIYGQIRDEVEAAHERHYGRGFDAD
jgi:5'-deoxynucleotidase YfbR-like HD superfamily hydrolase